MCFSVLSVPKYSGLSSSVTVEILGKLQIDNTSSLELFAARNSVCREKFLPVNKPEE